mgnify:FL=1
MNILNKLLIITTLSFLVGCFDQVDRKTFDEAKKAYEEEYKRNLELEAELTKSKKQYENMKIALSDKYSDRLTWYFYCHWLNDTFSLIPFFKLYGSVSDSSYVSAIGLIEEIKSESIQSDQFKRELELLSIGHNSIIKVPAQ